SPRLLLPHTPLTTPSTPSLHDALPIYGRNYRLGQTFYSLKNLLPVQGNPFSFFSLQATQLFYICSGYKGFITGPGYNHPFNGIRSEEHTSELQSRFDLVCRLLLEKKKT